MATKTAPARKSVRKKRTSSSVASKKTEAKKDLSKTYNEYKDFEGQQYTRMKVGRSHKWYYDKGEWKETKITPDLWEISYAVTKRRAGKAPEGSGVPVDTEYHWYILAHQNVRKLNANNYRGIGNAYADEILWEAGISPFSVCNKIPYAKIKALNNQ